MRKNLCERILKATCIKAKATAPELEVVCVLTNHLLQTTTSSALPPNSSIMAQDLPPTGGYEPIQYKVCD